MPLWKLPCTCVLYHLSINLRYFSQIWLKAQILSLSRLNDFVINLCYRRRRMLNYRFVSLSITGKSVSLCIYVFPGFILLFSQCVFRPARASHPGLFSLLVIYTDIPLLCLLWMISFFIFWVLLTYLLLTCSRRDIFAILLWNPIM